MALLSAMRRIAKEEWGWADRDIDVAISAYMEAGTMTMEERVALLAMNFDERAAWAVRRAGVDGVPAIVWDFNAHGFVAPGFPVAKFADPPWGAVGERSSAVPQFGPEGVCPDGQTDADQRDVPSREAGGDIPQEDAGR